MPCASAGFSHYFHIRRAGLVIFRRDRVTPDPYPADLRFWRESSTSETIHQKDRARTGHALQLFLHLIRIIRQIGDLFLGKYGRKGVRARVSTLLALTRADDDLFFDSSDLQADGDAPASGLECDFPFLRPEMFSLHSQLIIPRKEFDKDRLAPLICQKRLPKVFRALESHLYGGKDSPVGVNYCNCQDDFPGLLLRKAQG